jgi:DNA-binding transcriptional regulator YhcF (GntR family)
MHMGRQRLHRADERRTRRLTTADDVQRTMLLRIAAGIYRPQSRVPSCEDLAAEIGANKNTVLRAYRALADRGYLEARPGRGTYVTSRGPSGVLSEATAELRRFIELAVEQARLGGMDPAAFRALVDDIVETSYGQERVRVGYVDCDVIETPILTEELARVLAYPVEPLLLSDVVRAIEHYLDTFDILVVNLTHVLEVEDAVRRSRSDRGPAEIVSLFTPPDAESLTRVMRAPAGTRVGLVCATESAIETISGLVRATNSAVVLSSALVDDRARLVELASSVELILVTSVAKATVEALGPRAPIVPVPFRIDEREARRVGLRLAARLRPYLRNGDIDSGARVASISARRLTTAAPKAPVAPAALEPVAARPGHRTSRVAG